MPPSDVSVGQERWTQIHYTAPLRRCDNQVLVINLHLALSTPYWTWIHVASQTGSIALYASVSSGKWVSKQGSRLCVLPGARSTRYGLGADLSASAQ